jgi:hypothetical protein
MLLTLILATNDDGHIDINGLSYPTTTPAPTSTPYPDSQVLDCEQVQIAGESSTMRLCSMPDGMTCLFEYDKPTTCYSTPGGSNGHVN